MRDWIVQRRGRREETLWRFSLRDRRTAELEIEEALFDVGKTPNDSGLTPLKRAQPELLGFPRQSAQPFYFASGAQLRNLVHDLAFDLRQRRGQVCFRQRIALIHGCII